MPDDRINANAEAALDAPLPDFPDIAWRGIFGDYRDMMASDPEEPGTPVSECPETFHFANFLAVAAAEMGDKVRMAEGFANFFIFCCGRTGTKKSTASDYVEDYITKRFPEEPYHVSLGSVSSGEGLVRCLIHHPNLLLRYDEGKDLFATSSRIGSRIEPILNRAYDLRPVEAIVKRKSESLIAREYFFNLLLNATPDHVLIDMSEALFKGGLLNRFLMFAAKPTDVVKPEKGVPDLEIANAIAQRLYNQCLLWRTEFPRRESVRMRLSPEAKEMHKEWYSRYTTAQKNMNDLDAGPLTRIDTMAKKVAMVYTLYELTPTKEPLVPPENMEAGISVAEYSAASMKWVTAAWIGSRSQQSQMQGMAEQRIESYLRMHGCTAERYLYRYLHLSAFDCGRAVDALTAMGVAATTGIRPRIVHLIGKCTCYT